MMDWHGIEDEAPPPHTRVLFQCSDGAMFAGSACYGMHLPYWCVDLPNGSTMVINDFKIVTHWMLAPEPRGYIPSPAEQARGLGRPPHVPEFTSGVPEGCLSLVDWANAASAILERVIADYERRKADNG